MAEESVQTVTESTPVTGQSSKAAVELASLNQQIADTQTAEETVETKEPEKAKEQPKTVTQQTPVTQAEVDELEKLSPEELRKHLRESRKQTENQKKLIDRFGNEIGELRKHSQALLSNQPIPQNNAQPVQQGQGLPEVDGAEFVTNPLEAYRKLQARVQMEEQQRLSRLNLETQLKIQQNRQYLDQTVPEHAEMANDLYEVFKADNGGNAPFDFNTFQTRLYQEAPGTVLNMAKRAKAEKQVGELKAKLEEAEAKYEKLLHSVSGKRPARPTVSGTSGGATATNGIKVDLERLSPREQLAHINTVLAGT